MLTQISLQHIFFGGIAVGGIALIAPPAPGTPPYNRVSLWRGLIVCLCATGMACHGLWFYWLAEGYKSTPCGTWVYPFGIIDHFPIRNGPMITYALSYGMAGVIWPLTQIIVIMLASPDLIILAETLWRRAWTHKSSNPNGNDTTYAASAVSDNRGSLRKLIERLAAQVRPRYIRQSKKARFSPSQRRVFRLTAITTSILCMVWTVVGVELMLNKNYVREGYSMEATGQVIPLVIGAATAVKLGVNAFSNGLEVPPLVWGFFVRCFSGDSNAILALNPSYSSFPTSAARPTPARKCRRLQTKSKTADLSFLA